jgi:hypothetical protein
MPFAIWLRHSPAVVRAFSKLIAP